MRQFPFKDVYGLLYEIDSLDKDDDILWIRVIRSNVYEVLFCKVIDGKIMFQDNQFALDPEDIPPEVIHYYEKL